MASRNGRVTCRGSESSPNSSPREDHGRDHAATSASQPTPASSAMPSAYKISQRAGTRNRSKPGSRASSQLAGLKMPNASSSPTTTQTTAGKTPARRHCHAPTSASASTVSGSTARYSLKSGCCTAGSRARPTSSGFSEKDSTSLTLSPPWRLDRPASSSVGSSCTAVSSTASSPPSASGAKRRTCSAGRARRHVCAVWTSSQRPAPRPVMKVDWVWPADNCSANSSATASARRRTPRQPPCANGRASTSRNQGSQASPCSWLMCSTWAVR